VGAGVAGSILLAMGLPLLVLGALRALQTETGDHLTGNLTWIPYLGAAALSLVFIGLAVLGMTRNSKRRN
jgi:branched-subunit amino acid permease